MTNLRITPAGYLAVLTLLMGTITVIAWNADWPLVYLAGLPATMGSFLVTLDLASHYRKA